MRNWEENKIKHYEKISKALKKTNIYDLSGNFGVGYTTNGYEFYFDKEDFDKIKDFCWYKGSNGYILSNLNHSSIRLHRLILGKPILPIDHINHKVNDNRKSNLRVCSYSENNYNRGIQRNNTSGVVGVCWNNQAQKWYARITVNKTTISLGLFDDLEKAKTARKEAETKYFKDFAYTGD